MALILSGDTGVPASGMPTGSVIQTVLGSITGQVSTTSGSYASSGLTASITPIATTSKILITVMLNDVAINSTSNHYWATIYRNNTTNLSTASNGGLAYSLYALYATTNGGNAQTNGNISFLDSPATTSATTYTVYHGTDGGATGAMNWNNQISYIILQEIKG
jgi:hypothetical protein